MILPDRFWKKPRNSGLEMIQGWVFGTAWLICALLYGDESWRQTAIICAVVYHAVLILKSESR